jgi:hypothetical protein
MKRGTIGSFLIVLTVVSVVGLGANAFAGWGRGYGPGMQRGSGGYGYNCPYNRVSASEEDLAKMDQERQAFFKQTEDLRSRIADKEKELQVELGNQTPDAAKASEIQKALSDLYSQFDQSRLDHMIRMRQINPNAGAGYMAGRMMGQGPGRGGFGPGHGGQRMGRGMGMGMGMGARSGYCW